MFHYRHIRMALTTFAFGLAAFSFCNWFNDPQDLSVDLPKVESDTIILVTPIRGECVPPSGSHYTYDWPTIKKCRKEVGYR